ARTGQPLRRIRAHASHARSVAFSPDGKWLASTQWAHRADPKGPGAVKLWDVQTGQELRHLKGPHARGANRVRFSPDGRRLAASRPGEGPNGEVRIWDAATGEYLFSLRGHEHDIGDVAFSPHSQRLATVSANDQEVKVWDTQARRELLSFRGQTRLIPS